LESRFELAAQKLEHLSGANALAGWNEKIVLKSPSQPLLPPRINQAVLEIVQDSLLHDKQICARYRAAGSNESNEVVLHPLGLVQRDAATYLVATAFHYRDIRLYALHRIRRAECLEATANRPERFSLEDYVDQGAMGFGVGESVELKGKIHKDFAFYLRETPLSEDMKMLGDGEWLDFSATVRDTWQLKWWLRSYAESIVIQEPKRFRDDIVADLKSTLNHYESV
jgi:predicted DNA-binding transcriptional regulator YafY